MGGWGRCCGSPLSVVGAPIAVVKASEGGEPGGEYLVNLQGLDDKEVRGARWDSAPCSTVQLPGGYTLQGSRPDVLSALMS